MTLGENQSSMGLATLNLDAGIGIEGSVGTKGEVESKIFNWEKELLELSSIVTGMDLFSEDERLITEE